MFKNYTNAIEQGSNDARIRIAQMYEDGEFEVIVNKQKAYELYQDIPDREESMNSIGLLLYNKNQYESAAEWYRK